MFGYFKQGKKFFQKKSPGSALIMVMIMMVNAILIMSAATAISFRESKNSGIAKNSAIALQGADSGIEWALEEYRPHQNDSTSTLKNVFGTYDETSMTKLGSDIGLGSENNLSLRFYFVDKDNKPMPEGDTIDKLYFIRSVATVTAGGGIEISRALEARVKED